VRRWTFASSSGPGSYTTTLADDGKLLCNCKGWTMRRGAAPRHCKHTKQIAKDQAVDVRGEFVYLRGPDAPTTAGAWREASVSAPAPDVPAPMLASAMDEAVTGAAFDRRFGIGWLLEEKLDGHRCTVVVNGQDVRAFSRPRAGSAAKSRDVPAHVVTSLRHLPAGIYDGELVAPSGKAWDVVTIGAALVFVAFDVLQIGGVDLLGQRYDFRRARLLECLRELPSTQRAVSTVESLAPTWAQVRAIWKRGGEGAILKRVDITYRPGYRSPDWIKVKASRSATLTITGFAAGKSGPYSALRLRDRAGVETTVKTLGNALLREISATPDRYIGRRVVITYQEKTPTGTYRHGIFDHFAGDGE